jgi:polyferredoxin
MRTSSHPASRQIKPAPIRREMERAGNLLLILAVMGGLSGFWGGVIYLLTGTAEIALLVSLVVFVLTSIGFGLCAAAGGQNE